MALSHCSRPERTPQNSPYQHSGRVRASQFQLCAFTRQDDDFMAETHPFACQTVKKMLRNEAQKVIVFFRSSFWTHTQKTRVPKKIALLLTKDDAFTRSPAPNFTSHKSWQILLKVFCSGISQTSVASLPRDSVFADPFSSSSFPLVPIRSALAARMELSRAAGDASPRSSPPQMSLRWSRTSMLPSGDVGNIAADGTERRARPKVRK